MLPFFRPARRRPRLAATAADTFGRGSEVGHSPTSIAGQTAHLPAPVLVDTRFLSPTPLAHIAEPPSISEGEMSWLAAVMSIPASASPASGSPSPSPDSKEVKRQRNMSAQRRFRLKAKETNAARDKELIQVKEKLGQARGEMARLRSENANLRSLVEVLQVDVESSESAHSAMSAS